MLLMTAVKDTFLNPENCNMSIFIFFLGKEVRKVPSQSKTVYEYRTFVKIVELLSVSIYNLSRTREMANLLSKCDDESNRVVLIWYDSR